MVNTSYDLTFWGLFKEKQTEKEFITKISSDITAHDRVAILVAGLGYWAVSVADYAKLGISSGFFSSVIARSIFLLLCISVFFLLKRNGSYKLTIDLSFLVAISSSILIISVIYFLNPDGTVDTIDQITVPVVTLLMYIFMQMPLIMLFINGLTVTILYTVLLLVFMKDSADSTINIIAILVVINFMGIYLNRFLNISRRRDYANQTTIELLNENLKQEIEERKATQYNLEHALEQITDSIQYAQKIQFALLPSNTIIEQNFKESAIFFRPKNIVSGDFYWVYKKDDIIAIAVADCTGHGIPGAFMSVLGISLLNDIIRSTNQNDHTISAKNILNNLRDLVIKSLNKGGEDTDRRDGMDMSLLVINKTNRSIEFAGAYSPIWLLHTVNGNPEITEFRGDKMPIGMHTRKIESFSGQIIPYQNNDIIYMFTDGYKDQFGGNEGKKFLSKQFKDIILSVHQKPLQEQGELLSENFDNWKGEHPQVDDVLVMALKL